MASATIETNLAAPGFPQEVLLVLTVVLKMLKLPAT
jgi:hypothetical protein